MRKIGIGLMLLGTLCGYLGSVQAAIEQKVMLMLGGQYCDLYLGDVESALKQLPGVKAVDIKSMKGHAIVTVEGDKTTSSQLVKAVNGVKGDGWHCSAQVMK
ncbi:MAG: cation transporter [Nitrospira sp.]|nr:cation transporter [Nitrospira sp.]